MTVHCCCLLPCSCSSTGYTHRGKLPCKLYYDIACFACLLKQRWQPVQQCSSSNCMRVQLTEQPAEGISCCRISMLVCAQIACSNVWLIQCWQPVHKHSSRNRMWRQLAEQSAERISSCLSNALVVCSDSMQQYRPFQLSCMHLSCEQRITTYCKQLLCTCHCVVSPAGPVTLAAY